MNAAWLAQPWSGALLGMLADPAAELDPATLPDWPDWAPPLDTAVLPHPARRGQLGRCMLDASSRELAEIAFAQTEPRVRLCLVPADQAVELMAKAAAWLDAPRLGTLLRRAEVAAAQASLGEAAFAFATGRAKLMPRPGEALLAALPSQAAPLLDRGAALFGLAMGSVPEALTRRMRLRRPGEAWETATRYCRIDRANHAAFTALRRLVREGAPSWSSWLT